VEAEMPTFEVNPPDRAPRTVSRVGPPGTYTVHPLTALDGVVIHVVLNGETVGLFFGKTEVDAAAAVVDGVLQPASTATNGGPA
jgi:hypothetical protein